MSFMEQIGGLLAQYASGGRPQTREEAHAHYDQIAGAVPPNVLGAAIGPALSALGRDQVRERVQNSATEMDDSQRAEFVQTLLTGLSTSGNLRDVGTARDRPADCCASAAGESG